MTQTPVLAVAALWLATAAPLPCAAQPLQSPGSAQVVSSVRTREVITSDPAEVVRATALEYSNLDLSSPNGLRNLVTRIEEAARAVCGRAPARPFSSRSAQEDYDQCVRTAVSGALTQLRIPRRQALAMTEAVASPAAD